MQIRRMRRDDLAMALDWAADEGWNPGLDDAAAFHGADPEGFFLGEVEGRPAAVISVVNHDPGFAFLGLYICAPAFRGQGHGLALWRAALAHAGTRCVGLDGVPDQQANYRRSGFRPAGRTIRYRGLPEAAPQQNLLPAEQADLARLIALDTRAEGYTRPAYIRPWLKGSATRRTLHLPGQAAAATYRQCRDGVKIGPFFAPDEASARQLLAASPFPGTDRPVFIDVPEHRTALLALVEALGFTPAFETARMYTGEPPNADPPPYHAVATLELG